MERAQQAQAQLQTQLEHLKRQLSRILVTQARIHNVSTENATNIANNI